MDTVRIDAYVLDTLMHDLVGHDRQPSAFLVYLYLWRRTDGGAAPSEPVALREIAEGTGVSRRAVQSALERLVKRKLVSVEREGITAVPRYTVHRPWAGRRE